MRMYSRLANGRVLKGELGELEFYFRKIPLHQQNFLVVQFFLIRLGCREI